MKRLLLLALLVSFSASAERVRPEVELTEVKAYIVWFDSVSDLRAHLVERGFETTARRITAYSAYDIAKQRCVVFTVRPRKVDGPRVTSLGHEILHCLTGDYHK